MPTATENRVAIVISPPKQIITLIENESKFSGLAVATLIRQMIKWHAGKAMGRHASAPAARLPKRGSATRKNKTVLIDEEDAEHLDKMASRTGFSRVTILMLVIYAWFDIDPTPRKK